MSCCTAGHLGSGVGQPDLNQYLPSLCLFQQFSTICIGEILHRYRGEKKSCLCLLVKATKEVQRIASNDGLLLAAGGEGGLTDGQGRLVLRG